MDFRNNSNPGYPSGGLAGSLCHFRDEYVHAQSLPFSRDFIKSYASSINDGKIVEIGVLGGATLLDLYEICKKNNNKIYGIDPFENIKIFNGVSEEDTDINMQKDAREVFKTNKEKLNYIISKYNLNDVINIIAEPSINVVSQFEDNSIDLLHIDGDHSTEGVYNDLVSYWPKMKKGTGIIIGDDFDWQSVKNGLYKFCQEYHQKYVPGCSDYKFIIHA